MDKSYLRGPTLKANCRQCLALLPTTEPGLCADCERDTMQGQAVKRIAPGHYEHKGYTIRNVFSASGAPHTRNARAKWLVIQPDGRSFFVPTLQRAREIVAS